MAIEKKALIIMWIRDDQTKPDGYVIRTMQISDNTVINETNVLQYEFWNFSTNSTLWINNSIPVYQYNWLDVYNPFKKFNTGMINQPPKQDNTVYSLSFKNETV